MKKYTSSCTPLLSLLIWLMGLQSFSLPAGASDLLKPVLQSDTSVRPGYSVAISATFSGTRSIAAVKTELSFDQDHLAVKSVTLANRQPDDIMEYFSDDGCLRIIIATGSHPESEHSLRIVFQPRNAGEGTVFSFSMLSCEAIDEDENYLTIASLPSTCVTVAEKTDKTSVDQSKNSTSEESSRSERQASEKKHASQLSDSIRNSDPQRQQETENSEPTSSREERNRLYIQQTPQKEPISQSAFLAIAGIAVVFVGSLLFTYFIARKKRH